MSSLLGIVHPLAFANPLGEHKFERKIDGGCKKKKKKINKPTSVSSPQSGLFNCISIAIRTSDTVLLNYVNFNCKVIRNRTIAVVQLPFPVSGVRHE